MHLQALALGILVNFVGSAAPKDPVDVRFERIWRAKEESYRAGDRSAALLVELAEINACHPLGSTRANLLFREALRADAAPALRVRAAEGAIRILAVRGRHAEAIGIAEQVGQPLFSDFQPDAFDPPLSPLEQCEIALGRTARALARLRADTALPAGDRAATIGELLAFDGKLPEAERHFREALREPALGRTRELTDALAAVVRAQGREDEADALDDSEERQGRATDPSGSRPARRAGDVWAAYAREVWFETRGCYWQALFYARERARLLAADPAREDELAQALERAAEFTRHARVATQPRNTRTDPRAAATRWEIVRRRWVTRAAGHPLSGSARFPGRAGLALAARELAGLHFEHGDNARGVSILEDARALIASDRVEPDAQLVDALAIERALRGELDAAASLVATTTNTWGHTNGTLSLAELDHARGRFDEAFERYRKVSGPADLSGAPFAAPPFFHGATFRRYFAPDEVPPLSDLEGI